MEIFNSSNIPDLKEGETIVPLFTLDTFLLPEDQMMMRAVSYTHLTLPTKRIV